MKTSSARRAYALPTPGNRIKGANVFTVKDISKLNSLRFICAECACRAIEVEVDMGTALLQPRIRVFCHGKHDVMPADMFEAAVHDQRFWCFV